MALPGKRAMIRERVKVVSCSGLLIRVHKWIKMERNFLLIQVAILLRRFPDEHLLFHLILQFKEKKVFSNCITILRHPTLLPVILLWFITWTASFAYHQQQTSAACLLATPSQVNWPVSVLFCMTDPSQCLQRGILLHSRCSYNCCIDMPLHWGVQHA